MFAKLCDRIDSALLKREDEESQYLDSALQYNACCGHGALFSLEAGIGLGVYAKEKPWCLSRLK